MDIQNVVSELKKQRDLLFRAIAALQGMRVGSARRGRPPKIQGNTNVIAMPARRSMSLAARKRISEAMKKRWAQNRRSTARAA